MMEQILINKFQNVRNMKKIIKGLEKQAKRLDKKIQKREEGGKIKGFLYCQKTEMMKEQLTEIDLIIATLNSY